MSANRFHEPNRLANENASPGTLSWQLNDPATNREIEGYASKTSIGGGETIDFFVNTSASKFSIGVYRMGWYGGKGGRLMKYVENLEGVPQEIPLPDPITGLVECDWSVSYQLKTTSDWAGGVYLAKLETLQSGKQSYIIFVVRNDDYVPDILFQLPVTTYQAYNCWGGKSLYEWGSGSITSWGSKAGKKASKVSFLRPYVASGNRLASYGMGAGEFLCNVQPVTVQKYPISSAGWDYNMVRWLEKNGYDVGYCTNIDVHTNNSLLQKVPLFMSHGHDEYWSSAMRKHVEERRAAGRHLAFFSSNTMFWQIRLEPSIKTGIQDSTMVCYKEYELDPVKDENCTVHFREFPVKKPESALIGVEHAIDPVNGDIVICKEQHWVFANTKLNNGDILHGLLGYEVDGVTQSSPKNISILAASKAKNLLADNLGYALWRKFKFYERKTRRLNSILGFNKNSGPLILLFTCFLTSVTLLYMVAVLNMYLFMGVLLILLVLLLVSLGKEMHKVNMGITKKAESNMTMYVHENGAHVFATGSMQWSWGLDDYNVPTLRTSRKNNQVEIITKNLLKRLIV